MLVDLSGKILMDIAGTVSEWYAFNLTLNIVDMKNCVDFVAIHIGLLYVFRRIILLRQFSDRLGT